MLIKLPVFSSAIAELEWDDLDFSLFVSFHKGGTYILRKVPRELAESFAASPSPGSFWNVFMKGRF